MANPVLIFVAGCNAAGKSTFIRTRLNELEAFEVLMTDVYKERTKDLATNFIKCGKDIVIETVFNDPSFIDVVSLASQSNYKTSLVVLFLDNLSQSDRRVAARGIEQNGIVISGTNVKINFEESFKNIANYYLYFDRTDFIYTGTGEVNELIMSFHRDELIAHVPNDLVYPKRFAEYSYRNDRLSYEACNIITSNIAHQQS